MSRSSHVRRHATLDDFLAIPEDQRFHELLGDEIVEKAAPSGEHGGTQGRLAGHVGFPFDRRPGGRWPGGWWFATEVELKLGNDVCRPDVVGWRRDKVPERPRGKQITIVPDWTCEILSDGNRRNDLVYKKYLYHRHRVGHYWILDPEEQTISVNRWHPDGYIEVLGADRTAKVRAEPFEAIEFPVGVFFGDDPPEE